MKLAAYLLIVLLLSLSALAENNAKPALADNERSPQVLPGRRIPLTDDEAASLTTEKNTCYTIRAYLFERSQTTDTPRPAGMTTCVPHNPRALKRIEKKPVKSDPAIYVTY